MTPNASATDGCLMFMMNNRTNAPSLQSIAFKAVCRRYVNSKRIADIMRYFEKIDWMIEQGPRLKEECMDFIVRTFQGLKKRYDREVLQELIGEEALCKLESQLAETQKYIARSKITGSVIERAPVLTSESSDSHIIQSKLTRSVSGKAVYSYDALKAGRSWPSDVSVSNREQHLDNDEFHRVFSMSYDTYCSYPAWKRDRLKKEKQLF